MSLWSEAGGAAEMPVRHSDKVHCLAFAPCGQLLVTGGSDVTRVWSVVAMQGEDTQVGRGNASEVCVMLFVVILIHTHVDGVR